MKAQARLRRLAYRNPDEELGERYHSSPEVLRLLNPGLNFRREGQAIWAPNIHSIRKSLRRRFRAFPATSKTLVKSELCVALRFQA